jgi:VIT1/CCC1 family predicted Fe2+/Mn2+ transporter
MLMIILLVVLVLAVVGAVPAWPHSRSWGYYPSSGLGLVLVVLLILYLLGYLRF